MNKKNYYFEQLLSGKYFSTIALLSDIAVSSKQINCQVYCFISISNLRMCTLPTIR